MSGPERKSRSTAQIAAIGGAAGLLVLAASWFLLISPKRAEASKLEDEIAATEQQLEATRAAAAVTSNAEPIRYADLFRLAKAMPDESDHAGIVLELNRVATDSGIQFDEIAPGGMVTLTGYRVVPIELKFEGNFFNLSDFLYRLRNLVGVENGQLTATGRLFTVDKLIFSESERGFPQINATLNVSAFLYGSGSVAVPGSVPAGSTTSSADTSASTTAPTDTTATTTPDSSAAASAAPAP